MTPAIATEIHRLAAEGLSQRQIAEHTGCTRPAVARVLRAAPPAVSAPPPPAPAEPPATPLDVEIYGPSATRPRRAARLEPAPEPLSAMQLARIERARLDAASAERVRRAIEDHGYKNAPRYGGWGDSTSSMGPGGRGGR